MNLVQETGDRFIVCILLRVTMSLPTRRRTQTQNKCTQTSMPLAGFEPTILMFERAKTVHALDRAVTITGLR
jgi:hypothetical protein